MQRRKHIFYNALILTGVNLLLRLVSTSFQVFISGRIGAAGVGILQMVMSVASLTMTAGIAGIRTAAMYLTAEELGRKRPQNVIWVLSACFLYGLCFGGAVGGVVYGFAPSIAKYWIGDLRVVGAIRLFAAFLPVTCLTGVMTGYFTAANRIGTLAAVEVAEQFCSMAVTTAALVFWAGRDIGKACQSVVLGGCLGGLLTLISLAILRVREREETGTRIPMAKRLAQTALPLALADDLKAGISTTENLMVPKRLSLYAGRGHALAQFGIVCGMVFPVLMFPAAILYGLADLLIPELARCNAAGSKTRIRYLVRRSLRVALLYGACCGGLLFLLSEPICLWLYKTEEAGMYLRWFALLAPMLYCDAIIDAMTKGLGQQKICVRNNILTSGLDLVLLYLLLPAYGIRGYFFSFFVSHLLNALLSLRLLLKISGMHIPVWIPAMTIAATLAAVKGAGMIENPIGKTVAYVGMLFSLLCLLQVVHREDFLWLLGLIRPGGKTRKNKKIPELF